MSLSIRQNILKILESSSVEQDLAFICLLLENQEYPDQKNNFVLNELRHFSELINKRLGGARAPSAVAEKIAALLFEERGYDVISHQSARAEDYFLSHVMNQRRGVALLIAVIYSAIAIRLHMNAKIAVTQSHTFVILSNSVEKAILYADQYGEIVQSHHLQNVLDILKKEDTQAGSHYLFAAIQKNLINIYLDRHDFLRALSCADWWVFFLPQAAAAYLKRAEIYELLGHIQAAKDDYLVYLRFFPQDSAIWDKIVRLSQKSTPIH